jgi:2-desacetyl-2-hydroxyethyl bacteriochlorophyllide A dehydrogenase
MINRIYRVPQALKTDFLEKEITHPKGREVLIKVKASCICGSDLHIYRDRHPSVKLPVTIGHEFTGEVLETGSEVRDVQKGDRVVVEPAINCGTCEACRRGEYNFCENLTFTYREGHGAMADYFLGTEEHIFKLPPDISWEEGALTEPLSVAVHACRRAQVGLGDKVLVIGAGAIGIMIAAVSKKMGAKEVVISDVREFRLKAALNLGATRSVCAGKEDLNQVISGLSSHKGFDIAFECVGAEATLKQAMELVKNNGLVIDVGIFEKTDIRIDASLYVKKELRLKGAQGYCFDFPYALWLLGEIPFGQLITHRFKLSDFHEAIETAANPEADAIKVCVFPDGK